MKKKIIICRPYANDGGPLVLSVLCKILCEKGYDAKLFYYPWEPWKNSPAIRFWIDWIKETLRYLYFRYTKKNPKTKEYKKYIYNQINGLKRILFPFFSCKDTIVIYPERIYGNPLRAKNVIRYFLFHNPFKADPNAFGRNDLFITYREVFNDWSLNPKCNTVTFKYFNKDLYKQYNFGQRKEKCYLIRKGKNRSDLPKTFDGPVIDYNTDEEDIVRIFNEYKYCFFYDIQTFYTNIAAVCGCIPICVLESGKTKFDYLRKDDNSLGIAYGNTKEEIEYAKTTREQLLKTLDYTKQNEENINKFIQLINEKFV